jgi:hypothetical protein
MAVNKAALHRIFALAMMLACTAWQPVRAEDSVTLHGRDSGSCARSAFRVLIDVGHTATSPGADSARGVPEYEFNLKLADVIAQSLHEAGFDKTVRLVTDGTRMASLFERVASANHLNADSRASLAGLWRAASVCVTAVRALCCFLVMTPHADAVSVSMPDHRLPSARIHRRTSQG